MSSPVLYQKSKHIATITFNKPESLNALDESMGYEFAEILNNIKKDPEVRALVITGAGRAFSSGGNLAMLEERVHKDEATNKRELKEFYQLFLGVRDLDIPVIAKINGHAVGAGFCLSLACDFRVASETAKMGANFARLGLAPGMGGTYLITRLLGPTRASEILMLGEIITAQKAYDFGLLNNVVPANELDTCVGKICETLIHNGPFSLGRIKKGMQLAMNATLEELFDYDSASQAKAFETKDIIEGIQAVKEKRLPDFKGH